MFVSLSLLKRLTIETKTIKVISIYLDFGSLFLFISPFRKLLEDTARYVGLLLAPAEGFSLQPRLFLPFRQKKRAYDAVLAHFGQFLVPSSNLVTFSSNLSNFERNP